MASRVLIPPLTFIFLPLQGPKCSGCPRSHEKEVLERGRGQDCGNRVLLGQERAPPWINRRRCPGLREQPFTPQVEPHLLQVQALTSKLTCPGPPASLQAELPKGLLSHPSNVNRR